MGSVMEEVLMAKSGGYSGIFQLHMEVRGLQGLRLLPCLELQALFFG